MKNLKSIIVAGGDISGNSHTNDCESFSITENRWRKLPPLNEKKSTPCLVSMSDKALYCIGGLVKETRKSLQTIEVLDLT